LVGHCVLAQVTAHSQRLAALAGASRQRRQSPQVFQRLRDAAQGVAYVDQRLKVPRGQHGLLGLGRVAHTTMVLVR
jgi:hypothetical protein